MRLVPPSPTTNDAEFDAKREHRYWLSRSVLKIDGVTQPVGRAHQVGLVLALNPSKAGVGDDNDATVRKWKGFAERWGWGGFWAGNLFSYIETESSKLRDLSYAHAVGEHNNAVLQAMVAVAPEIVLCWGNNVPDALKRRVGEVLGIVRSCKRPEAQVTCLGLTAQGAPWHVLRLGYDTPRMPWEFREKANRRE